MRVMRKRYMNVIGNIYSKFYSADTRCVGGFLHDPDAVYVLEHII